jgi:metal-dependent amidase/aminoacylase/carboxypeptidase family protein
MTAALKQIACDRVDTLSQTLVDVSHGIHAHPELAFAERHASAATVPRDHAARVRWD